MTYAPQPLRDLGAYWTSKGGTNLGVVGDAAHQRKGTSYHLGRSSLASGAYSAMTARDRAGLTEAASAIDLGRLGGSLQRLRAFSVWLVKQCQANAPGTSDIREVIYTPDGKTVMRYDRERGIKSAPRPGEASLSHLTHTHVSFYRDSEKRAKVGAFRPYFAPVKPATSTQEAPVATPIDLSTPSTDTVQLLRQYLQARKTPPATGFFADNVGNVESQIVQLTASIIGHGTAYYRKGAISVSVLKLARKLNAGNRFALTEPFEKSLASGEPEYARSIGVESGRITA